VDADGIIRVVNAGNAIVRITAAETEDWAGAVCEIAVTVAKGTAISGAPQNQMGVSSEIATTDVLVLPENWKVAETDAGKELPYNKPVAVVVVYTGADTDNYEETALTKKITVTRICDHKQTQIRGTVAATCSKEGYSGDAYCTDCATKVKSGNTIAKKTHIYDTGKIIKAATCKDAGVKTYTCSVCKATKTEAIPALGAPKKGTKATVNKSVYKVTKSSLTSGTVTYVSSENKKATSITIPAAVKIDGVTFKVTAIEKNAFKGNKKIKTITIGKNVTKIGDNAFYKCIALTKVTIPSKVTTIGKSAFYGCNKLKTVTIGKNVSNIGAKAFYGCSKLTTLTIKSTKLTAKKIGSKAFTNTSKSMKVNVPKKKFKAYKSMLINKGVNKKAKFKKS